LKNDPLVPKHLENLKELGKSALAQESHTGTQLVSPATGCEKKKKIPLEQGGVDKTGHIHTQAQHHKVTMCR